ncbi:sigma-54 interaction domain-containing protein [Paludibacterium purpuratum]|uniref:DNA-binding NtrC family response regulator n=1 Tax=Paludibacterium purpuratum TaxID=1144873 RepID=A0A4R7BCT4_9NEIS|nr:sigma-54 dependent transcriptional regulator [Paludibacterium purpuratum]TDR81972.1 DNA-binding NtrC family response regulator [Paludibacterium purpuratum]
MFESIRQDSSYSSVTSLPQPLTVSSAQEAVRAADSPSPLLHADSRFGRLYGASSAMQKVFRLIERVADSDASVLIVGESGCGKELIAQTIHEMSGCATAPFIAINCGALPVTLIESELFGYEKGAFTGANKTHLGFFERANGGTLFLDEITEMPLDLQVRLLRVLETGRFTRVGGDKEIVGNARMLAATNREPQEAVHDGKLRLDLLYRLAVFPIVLPPLRERDDDIILLAHRFLDAKNQQCGTRKRFAPGVEDKLRQHNWPGNVRELKNCIHRAYILADKIVDIDTLAPLSPRSRAREVIEVEVGTPLEEVERQLIFATLDRYQGNKRRTAKALGVSLKTIYNRLNFYADNFADPTDIKPSMA